MGHVRCITGSHHITGSSITRGSQCVDAASLGMMEAKRGGNHVVRRRARRRTKAANALSLDVPSTLIARADEMTE